MYKMPKDYTIRVNHMIAAGCEIIEYTDNLSLEDFIDDLKTLRSVERCFTIIGEAANKIPKDIQSIYPEIEWSQIIGFRHVITHDYDKTRHMIIWTAIKNDLPRLLVNLESVKQMMEKE